MQTAPQQTHPIPADEDARLRDLAAYDIHGTAPEADYDHVARLAADLFGVPIALVNLVGGDSVRVKARAGLDVCEVPRGVAFCAHAIMGDEPLVVPDLSADPRFAGRRPHRGTAATAAAEPYRLRAASTGAGEARPSRDSKTVNLLPVVRAARQGNAPR